MKSSTAIAALVVATIGLSALPAIAQNTASPTPVSARMADAGRGGMHIMMMHDQDGAGRGSILDLACSDKGSEALEIALVRLAHSVDLTAEQQTLFDAFRTKALTTQTSFADACKAAIPASTADAKPDLLTGLKSRLAVDTARLTALNDVLPSFEAFYNSLTDAQKTELLPGREHGMFGHFGDRGGMDRGGMMDRMDRSAAPGR